MTAVSMISPPRDVCEFVHGTNAPAVIEVIKARAARRRAGDESRDGRKIGLVIEGGGMRGVCSGGGAVALAHMGFARLFDEVYATSAGVMNASYFLSEQPELGISVYFESLVDKRFANPLRLWKVVDIDYVFDQVVTADKPLDVQAVLDSPTKFFVAVMDAKTGERRMVHTQSGTTPLLTILKAATALPVFYNRPVMVDGRACMDAGLIAPFPLMAALENGCTDVLVLLSRAADYRCRRPKLWQRAVFELLCARGNACLRRALGQRVENEAPLRDLALGRVAPPVEVNIATLCTDHEDAFELTTRDGSGAREAAIRFGRRTLRAFGFAEAARNWDLKPFE